MAEPGVPTINPEPSTEFPQELRERLYEVIPCLDNEISQAQPIAQKQREIMNCFADSQNSVIVGDTGSGKTVTTPIYLEKFQEVALEAGLVSDGRIVVTSPTRIATTENANDISAVYGTAVGGKVGYQVGKTNNPAEASKVSRDTKIVVMTEKILLLMMERDPLLREVSIWMADEAHKRTLDLEAMMGHIQTINENRKRQGIPPIKVVATSATIKEDDFTKHLAVDGKPAAFEKVEGRVYKVHEYYESETPDETNGDYIEAAAQKFTDILNGVNCHINEKTLDPNGDTLIFMPGKGEIEKTHKLLKQKLGPRYNDYEIVELYGRRPLTNAEKRRFAAHAEKGQKPRIFIATDMVETSVTLKGVVRVIDTGLIKQSEYNPDTGISKLETIRHSIAGLNQRKGRAGRVQEGICYRLFTEEDLTNGRLEFTKPEIERSDLGLVVLKLLKLGVKNPAQFDFIEKNPEKRLPLLESVRRSLRNLRVINAVDRNGITAEGRIIDEIGARPEYGKMLIEAAKRGVAAAMIDTLRIPISKAFMFLKPPEEEAKADKEKREARQKSLGSQTGSDFLKARNTWWKYIENNRNATLDDWISFNFLNRGIFTEAEKNGNDLMETLRELVPPILAENTCPPEQLDENLQKAIAAGLIGTLMFRSDPKQLGENDRNVYYEEVLPYTQEKSNITLSNRSIVSDAPYKGFVVAGKFGSAKVTVGPKIKVGEEVDEKGKKKDKMDFDPRRKKEIPITRAEMLQAVPAEWLEEIAPHLFEQRVEDVPFNDGVKRTIRIFFRGTDRLVIDPITKLVPNIELIRQRRAAEFAASQRQVPIIPEQPQPRPRPSVPEQTPPDEPYNDDMFRRPEDRRTRPTPPNTTTPPPARPTPTPDNDSMFRRPTNPPPQNPPQSGQKPKGIRGFLMGNRGKKS